MPQSLISTEGALRIPTTYDNHPNPIPSHQSIPIYSIEDDGGREEGAMSSRYFDLSNSMIFDLNRSVDLREGILRKNCCSFGFCPYYLPPPLPPIWTTCTTFFRRRNSRFESQFRTRNTTYTIYIYFILKEPIIFGARK